MYTYWVESIAPAIYKLKVRRGASKIDITCEWVGQGTVNLQLSSPEKKYTEDGLKVSEKTIISVNGISRYQCQKKASLQIRPLRKEENWTIKITTFQVSSYKLSIEVS